MPSLEHLVSTDTKTNRNVFVHWKSTLNGRPSMRLPFHTRLFFERFRDLTVISADEVTEGVEGAVVHEHLNPFL